MRLLEKSDVIVDCLDNIKSRLILEGASKKIPCPLVSAAVGGVWGHVTTIFPEDTGLSQIYGGPASVESKGAEASLGCLPYAVTLLASIECSEVIKILLNKGSVLRNQLLVVDLMSNIFDIAQLTRKMLLGSGLWFKSQDTRRRYRIAGTYCEFTNCCNLRNRLIKIFKGERCQSYLNPRKSMEWY